MSSRFFASLKLYRVRYLVKGKRCFSIAANGKRHHNFHLNKMSQFLPDYYVAAGSSSGYPACVRDVIGFMCRHENYLQPRGLMAVLQKHRNEDPAETKKIISI